VLLDYCAPAEACRNKAEGFYRFVSEVSISAATPPALLRNSLLAIQFSASREHGYRDEKAEGSSLYGA
jgi:hypothetical protein